MLQVKLGIVFVTSYKVQNPDFSLYVITCKILNNEEKYIGFTKKKGFRHTCLIVWGMNNLFLFE